GRPSIPFSNPWGGKAGTRGEVPIGGHASVLSVQAPLPTDAANTAPLAPSLRQTSGGRAENIEVASLRYLGPFQRLYLLFEQAEELILVDQHAASERILYERLLAQVSTHEV